MIMTDPVIMKREMTVEDCLNELNYIHIKLTEENVTYFNNFMDMITLDHNDKIVISAESPVPVFAVFPKTLRIMTTSGGDKSYHMSADNMLFGTLELSEFETNNSNSILLDIKLDNQAKLLAYVNPSHPKLRWNIRPSSHYLAKRLCRFLQNRYQPTARFVPHYPLPIQF